MVAIRGFQTPSSAVNLADHVEAIVRDLAERCVTTPCCQLGRDAENMSAAELRGYVRARAARPTRLLVRQLVAERRLPPQMASDIAARAAERIAHLIVRQQMMRPVAKTPILLPLRAAA
jgi:hypothetical protein